MKALFHKLLGRQIEKSFGASSPTGAEISKFISLVDEAYQQSDTDRQMLERSLELSSQELLQASSDLRAIFQVIPDLFFRLNRQGIILDYKAGQKTDFFAPPETLVGKKIQDIPIQEIGRQFEGAIQEVVRFQSQVTIEYKLKQNERTFYYEARLLPLYEDEIVTFIRDITEREIVLETLRDREELLRATLESTGDGILVVDQSGRVTHTNERFAKMWRIPRELVSTRDDNKLLLYVISQLKEPEFFLNKVQQLYSSTNDSQDSLEFKDGRIFERTSSPLMRGNSISGRVWIFKDVTERKLMELESRDLQEKLHKAEKMKSLGLMAGGIAHDLNNMLGPMVGYPQLVLEQITQDNPIRVYMERIEKAGKDAATVINDLLSLARRGRNEFKRVDLNLVITDFLQSRGYETLAQEKPGVGVELKLEENLPDIKGSAPHLEKIIMNLVFNAYDAVVDNGNILIETKMAQLTDSLPSGHADIIPGEYVTLKVKDNGQGIPKDKIKKIFEPYFTTKTMGGRRGSGLGLAVVYGVLKDHNGYYDIDSTVGEGTEFTFYFPADTSVIEELVTAMPMIVRGHEKLLIVDDDHGQRQLVKEMLASLGYHVETAINGRDAVAKCKTERFELMILDMIMEDDFDGLDTYKEIIKINPLQKVIIVSGFSDNVRSQEVQKLGASVYLKKPFDFRILAEAVRKELDSYKSKTAPG